MAKMDGVAPLFGQVLAPYRAEEGGDKGNGPFPGNTDNGNGPCPGRTRKGYDNILVRHGTKVRIVGVVGLLSEMELNNSNYCNISPNPSSYRYNFKHTPEMEVINRSEKIVDKQLLTLTHLSQLLNYVTGCGGLIAPLIIWLTQKDRVEGMDVHGKAIVNFQLSLLLYTLISIPAILLLGLGILALIEIGRAHV